MKGVRGEIVAGRYRIDEVVGTGGFGTVYAGRQINLDRDVAIKVMRQGPEGSAISRERFRREAVLSSSFSHPNIVTYHDFLIDDDGDMILVMEFLKGVTLDRILAGSGRMAVERAARIVVDVAAGLAECHRAGIVHRDIKPSNIFILDEGTTRERAKIIDFGILWTMPDFGAEVPGLTRANAFIGTPEYVAPEVLIGAFPDGRTDQYALALVALRAMTGQMPFPVSKGQAMLERLTSRPALLDSPVMAGCQAVRGVLYKALSPEPGDRFVDLDEFGRAMAAAADVRPAGFRGAGPGIAASGADDADSDETVVEFRRGEHRSAGVSVEARASRGRRWPAVVLVAGLACLALAAAGWSVIRSGDVERAGVVTPQVRAPAVAPQTQAPSVAPQTQAPEVAPVVTPPAGEPVNVQAVQPSVKPDSRPPVSEPAPVGVTKPRQAAVAPKTRQTTAAAPVAAAPAREPAVAAAAALNVQEDGALRINSVPWAYVTLDGREVGHTSIDYLRASPGKHTLAFRRDGFELLTRVVEVQGGVTQKVVVELKPIVR